MSCPRSCVRCAWCSPFLAVSCLLFAFLHARRRRICLTDTKLQSSEDLLCKLDCEVFKLRPVVRISGCSCPISSSLECDLNPVSPSTNLKQQSADTIPSEARGRAWQEEKHSWQKSRFFKGPSHVLLQPEVNFLSSLVLAQLRLYPASKAAFTWLIPAQASAVEQRAVFVFEMTGDG